MLRMLAIFTFVLTVHAQSGTEGADHPLVSRYAGSTMYRFVKQDYGDFTIATGRAAWTGSKLSNTQTVEGKLFHAVYFGPHGKSPLEVYRNFQQALAAAGFKPIYGCANAECADLFNNLYGSAYNGKVLDRSSALQATFTTTYGRDTRYLAAQLTKGGGTVWVSLEVGIVDKSWADTLKASPDQAFYGLAVVESAAMGTGNVTVDAAAMADSLRDTGKVALYNLYFDTNSATLKPESDAALAEIQKLLRTNPQKKLLVVGHTDNVGQIDYNLDLSKRRAASVVNALTTRYGVETQRLSPYGVANLAPVASNASEDGRARNRRVELVER
jgi:outer membrane protein OmpA-like peptidoglycan-associated protein